MLWVAIAALPVIALWLDSGVSPVAALRALAVAVLLAGVLYAVLAVPLGRHKAGIGAVLGYMALYVWPRVELLVLVGALLAVVVLIAPRVLRIPFPWPLATRAGNVLAVVLVAVVVGRGLLDGALSRLPADVADAVGIRPAPAAPSPAPTGGPPPDIYVLFLEDYPRADTLQRVFGFDNSGFLAGLRARGFTVADRARSNYSNSQLTLLTMLHAKHIEEIPELEPLRSHASTRQYPLLRALTNDAPVFELLRRAGYSITVTSPGYEQLTIRGVGRLIDGGQINDFEIAWLRSSALSSIADEVAPDLLGDQQRARVQHLLSFFAESLRDPGEGPRFVFAHVPTPHPPVVFGATGEPLRVPLTDPYGPEAGDPEGFRAAYVGQIRYLNQQVLQTLDGVADAPRPAVVVVSTDEGYGQRLDPDRDKRPLDSVAILFAARVPGGEDLFPAWMTPVNLFPILLDRYLGADLPLKSNRNYVSGSTAPFDGTEIVNEDAPPGS